MLGTSSIDGPYVPLLVSFTGGLWRILMPTRRTRSLSHALFIFVSDLLGTSTKLISCLHMKVDDVPV